MSVLSDEERFPTLVNHLLVSIEEWMSEPNRDRGEDVAVSLDDYFRDFLQREYPDMERQFRKNP